MATLPDSTALGRRPAPSFGTGVSRPTDQAPGGAKAATGGEAALHSVAGQQRAVAQYIEEEQIKRDRIEAEDALNKLKENASILQSDPNEGFGNKYGKTAIGEDFHKDYVGRLDKAAEDISSGLQTPGAKREFGRRRKMVEIQYKSNLMNHQSVQTDLYAKQVETDTAEATVRAIGQAPLDDMVYKSEKMRAMSMIDGKAEREGIDDKSKALMKEKWEGDAWFTRTMAVIDDHPETAKDFLKQGKKTMSAKQVMDIENVLKDSDVKKFSQLKADEITSAGKDDEWELDQARAITNPDKRAATVSLVKGRQNERVVMESRAQKASYDALIDDVHAASKDGAPMKWSDLPTTKIKAMSSEQQKSAKQYMEQLASGATVHTDPVEHSRLSDLFINNRASFDSENITGNPNLSAEHKLYFEGLKRSQAKPKTTEEQWMSAAIARGGYEAKKDREEIAGLQYKIRDRLRIAAEVKKSDLNEGEVKGIIDGVLLDNVYWDGWGRDSTKPMAEMSKSELESAYVRLNVDGKVIEQKMSEIPNVFIEKAEKQLLKKGMPVTMENVAEIFYTVKKAAK